MVFDYTPILLEEDYDKFMEQRKNLLVRRKKGELTSQDYNTEVLKLGEWLSERMRPEDRRAFRNVNGLRAILLQIMPFSKAQEHIHHELEHGEIAKDLGYDVEYGVWLMRGQASRLILSCFCHVLGEVSPEHSELILGMPAQLSEYDKSCLDALSQ